MSENQSEKTPEPVYTFSDNFSSAYFGKTPAESSGEQNPAHDGKLINNFIDLLTNPDKRELRSDALNTIRNAKAQQFLVDLIAMPQYEKHQRDLVMACWECGLDFSAHLIFFANLVANCGYPVALEAITVIDEMHDLSDSQLRSDALKIMKSETLSPDKQLLVSETIGRLESMNS